MVRATDLPILLYNIPQRTGSDMPNDLLAELAQLDNIVGVKQANHDNLATSTEWSSTPATTTCWSTCSRWARRAGSSPAAHIFGEEMRRMVDEPENRREIDAGLQDVYRDLAIAPAACSNKAALNMIGVPAGKPRLPYVELDADEQAVVRAMLERHGMLATAA